MLRHFQLYIVFLLICSLHLQAQEEFYQQDHIADIRLYFAQADWQYQLDSIFIASNGVGRLIGDVKIDGNYYKNVGVRYKGFSSWNQGEIKNPYNIELDYTLKNQNHKGFTKIKLSNVIHDPSFVREVLAYEIVRKYMPASHASYANLYVNDELIGLYSNVESVDKIFISRYFTDNNNSFIKGDPTELQFPLGQNANLAHTHGNDSLNYMPYYKLESVYGWKDLYNFIYVLNEIPDSIEKALNTDRSLWMHALNYSILNLDSYIAYAQNYYIYKDNNGRFNPIIWDLNMSFGSFRNSDASTHFQGLSINEMKVLDPLQHLSLSMSPRPLMTKLFQNNTYKRMYLAHMRTILDENIRNNWYFDRAVELRDIIRSSVQNDLNKFYSNADFENNLSVTVGGIAGMMQYPGLQDLMNNRLAYLDTYPGFAGSPIISDITTQPAIAEKGKDCWIIANISKAHQAFLAYRYHTIDVFTKEILYDDGAHQDGIAGDGIYGAKIIAKGTSVQYYIYAENDSAGRFSPERAEYVFYSLPVQAESGDLVINELKVAVLTNSPWMELLNITNENISLKGCYLANDFEGSVRWTFPDTIISPHSFLMISFTSDTNDPLFCNLNMRLEKGVFCLFNNAGKMIDHISYSTQLPGKSFGRYPNGYGSFMYMEPTPAKNNFIGTNPQSGFLLYPNPARDKIYIEYSSDQGLCFLKIMNSQGKEMLYDESLSTLNSSGSIVQGYDISAFPSGLYLAEFINNDRIITKKFIKY